MSYDDAAGLAVQQQQAATAATIKNNIYNAAAQSPDAAAANQNLARAANMPVESVAANPAIVKQLLAAQNVDPATLPPATAQFLANPQNAAIAHDDIANLTAVERGLASSPFDHVIQRTGRDLITGASYMGAPADMIARLFYTGAQKVGLAPADISVDEAQKMFGSFGGLAGQLNEWLFPGGSPETKGEALGDAAASMVGAAGLEKAPTALAAIWHGLTAATAGVAQEELQPKITEWAKTTFPNEPFLQEFLSQAGGLATLLGTGAAGHVVEGAVGHVADSHLEQTTKAKGAEATADQMTAINDLATQSKVRERSPEAFAQFIKDATDNSPVKDVYIDAKLLAQTAGKDLPALAQALPDIGEQLMAAGATGGDVRIPVSDFASKIAGTDLAAQLIPHLKTAPAITETSCAIRVI